MTTTVEQTASFAAPVGTVFAAIADAATHSAFTGAPATVSREVGAAFTTHGGGIEGRLIELVPNERIVQAWRPAGWPAGVYSLVRYEFSGDSANTIITLTHTGLPDGAAEHIAEGWNNMYWTPLAEYLKR
jgi:activator of HSP90 ATPase